MSTTCGEAWHKTAFLGGHHPARPIRGREQVRYSTGNRSQEMFADAATENGRTVAVLVTDSPPWGGLTAGSKRGPEGTDRILRQLRAGIHRYSRGL